MGFFEDRRWLPEPTLSREEVAYLREVLAMHANDPASGTCRVCRVVACRDWRSAYDQLAAAGELMAEPELWLTDEHAKGRPR